MVNDLFHLGFTGTQNGLSPDQAEALTGMFKRILTEQGQVAFHHGDCIGADVQAHALFHDLARVWGGNSCGIHIHPPDNPDKRAYADKHRGGAYSHLPMLIHPELPYMVRNEQIVLQSHLVIATPKTSTHATRSGTWSTARRARTAGTRVDVIYPNGAIDYYWEVP